MIFVMVLLNVEQPDIQTSKIQFDNLEQNLSNEQIGETQATTPDPKTPEPYRQVMDRKDFNEVKELFVYFSFNRTLNLVARSHD